MKVTSKAAIRTVPVGTLVQVTHFKWPEKANGLRRVVKVQSNAWVTQFVNPTPEQTTWLRGQSGSWLYFDKGVRCEFDDKGFTVFAKGEAGPLVRFDWVEAPESATA